MCELQSYSFQYLGRRFLLQPHVAIVKSNVSYTYNRKLQVYAFLVNLFL